jgi:hypothetical protein
MCYKACAQCFLVRSLLVYTVAPIHQSSTTTTTTTTTTAAAAAAAAAAPTICLTYILNYEFAFTCHLICFSSQVTAHTLIHNSMVHVSSRL